MLRHHILYRVLLFLALAWFLVCWSTGLILVAIPNYAIAVPYLDRWVLLITSSVWPMIFIYPRNSRIKVIWFHWLVVFAIYVYSRLRWRLFTLNRLNTLTKINQHSLWFVYTHSLHSVYLRSIILPLTHVEHVNIRVTPLTGDQKTLITISLSKFIFSNFVGWLTDGFYFYSNLSWFFQLFPPRRHIPYAPEKPVCIYLVRNAFRSKYCGAFTGNASCHYYRI